MACKGQALNAQRARLFCIDPGAVEDAECVEGDLDRSRSPARTKRKHAEAARDITTRPRGAAPKDSKGRKKEWDSVSGIWIEAAESTGSSVIQTVIADDMTLRSAEQLLAQDSTASIVTDAEAITPIHVCGDAFVKRDDLFDCNGATGSKARSILRIALDVKKLKRGDALGLVVAASRHSTMLGRVARVRACFELVTPSRPLRGCVRGTPGVHRCAKPSAFRVACTLAAPIRCRLKSETPRATAPNW